MLVLVDNLRQAFASGIDGLDWMSPETKKQAREKLSRFVTKIGYPDSWRDYSKLTIERGDLVGNIIRARQFEADRDLAKLGRPVDRGEWFMTPQTVNAYYNASLNEIVFPAAILQPPFFDPAADDAVNYGAIGAVIGHELEPRVRRSGAQVGRRGESARLVDPGGRDQVQGARLAARVAVPVVRAAARAEGERRAHAR